MGTWRRMMGVLSAQPGVLRFVVIELRNEVGLKVVEPVVFVP